VYGHSEAKTLTPTAGVALDANTGAVLRVVAPANFSMGTAFLRGLTSLHFGAYGHTIVQWLYFILGMAGAFLFYSGNLLWIETRRNRRGTTQTRSSDVMAKSTLGVCLGCMAGISAAFVATRLLPEALPDHASMVEAAYFTVFFASLVWAWVRSPIRAANELLIVCAVLTASIPVIDIATTGIAPWADAIAGTIALVSLAFAWGFWRMSCAVRKRGREGDPNSVWALRSSRPTAAAVRESP
jgi:uncharacterized iron-regulated membrane protein